MGAQGGNFLIVLDQLLSLAKTMREVLTLCTLPGTTKFILSSPMGRHEPSPPLHSSPAVGEEPPILLACLMACQRLPC